MAIDRSAENGGPGLAASRGILRTGVVLIGAVLVAFYWHWSSLFVKSSDQINYLLAGLDVLHGNVRLRGWLLSPPDFYTSDILLSAALGAVWRLLGDGGAPGAILGLQPAITWTSIVLSAAALSTSGVRTGRQRAAAVLVVFAILGLPLTLREPVLRLSLYSAIHLGSVLYCLLGFHLAARMLQGRRGFHSAALGACMGLGVFGDPMVVFVGVTPVLLWLAIPRGEPPGVRWRVACAAIFGAMAGEAALALNTLTGGFAVPALPWVFAKLGELPGNAAVILHGMLALFSADVIWRRPGQSVPELLHVALLIFAAAALIAAVRRSFDRGAAPGAALTGLLAWGAVLDIAAVLFSNRIELEGGAINSARYLFPAWIYLAILAGRWGAQGGRASIAAGCALMALGCACVVDAPTLLRRGPGLVPPESRALIAWLEHNAPAEGIGSYFAAAPLQLASGNRLHILPGQSFLGSDIAPLIQISRRFSFAEMTRHGFFVLLPPEYPTYSRADVLRTFGPPSTEAAVGGVGVLIYRRDEGRCDRCGGG